MNLSNEDQVNKLNEIVKVKLAPSQVHGIGVVAIRDIGKGQRLWGDIYPQFFDLPYSHFSKLFPEVRQLLLERWPGIAGGFTMLNGTRFAYPDTLLQAYMNHSDEPNYDPYLDLTLRDIKAGEEILEDYRQIDGWEEAHPWLLKVSPQNKEKSKGKVGIRSRKKVKNML